ncbi:PpiC-type peptidyl-prolyl cis-trans isomerase [Rhodoplanes sp. Z2-YC6860]|nr:PpiC-type peptidyl-prolyl cis-trans isomerase [Rhodoplanes sp. Z2-YC6860]
MRNLTERRLPTFPALPALRASTLGLLAAALIAVPAMAQAPASKPASAQPDKVIAKVQGVEIRESDLAMAEEDMGQQVEKLQGDAKRDALVGYLADVIIMSKAADAKKITEQKDFKTRVAFIRNKLAMEMLLIEEGKAATTDAAMKKVYDEAVAKGGTEQEVRARHILVPTEDEAKAVLAEIKKGTDFAELAKQKSKDPGAAAEGGDLGYFSKDQMVPEFAEVAFKLNKGEVSDPVKTQFGWHIIKVEDKRNKPVPTFDQVKDQIETYVARKAQAEYIAKQREANKVERLDK